MTNNVTASYELAATVQAATFSTSVTTNASVEPTATITPATSSRSITANLTAYDKPPATMQAARSSLDVTRGVAISDKSTTTVALKAASSVSVMFKASISSDPLITNTETSSSGAPNGSMTSPTRSFFTSHMSEVARSDSVTGIAATATSRSLTQGSKASRSEAGTTTRDVPKSTEKLISSPTSAITDAATNDATTTPGRTAVVLGSLAFPSPSTYFIIIVVIFLVEI